MFISLELTNYNVGIVQNAETEIVKLVEDMVVSHIAGNCLILVALPMTGKPISLISYFVRSRSLQRRCGEPKGTQAG